MSGPLSEALLNGTIRADSRQPPHVREGVLCGATKRTLLMASDLPFPTDSPYVEVGIALRIGSLSIHQCANSLKERSLRAC